MRFLKFLFVAAVLGSGTLPLAVKIAPWLYCAATPVRLRMVAPLNTQVRISWDAGSSQSLPFVPQANPDGVSANLWLAELPPRPVYHIALIFPARLDHVELRRFMLFDEREMTKRIFERISSDPTPWFTVEGIESTYVNKGLFLSSPAGGRLTIPATIDLSPQSHVSATLGLWAGLFAMASVALLLIVPLFKSTADNTGSTTRGAAIDRARATEIESNKQTLRQIFMYATRGLKSEKASDHPLLYAPGSWEDAWPIWSAFVVGTFIHITLILHSPVVLAGGDSGIYLIKGITLARHFRYDTDPQFDLCRLPGYPLIICLLVKTIGYRLTRIAVFQGLLFCSSMLCLALATRKWIHPLVGGVAVLMAILSPAEVWGSRTILSESTFASFSYFAIAAYFVSIGSTGMRSKRWLIGFGCLAAYAVFIRPNGVSLYVGLLPTYVPAIVAIVRSAGAIGEKVRAAARVTLLYIITGSILLAAILGWSIRNYRDQGYFGASDMTGVTLVCGLMVSGTFDVNSLVGTGQYDQYILRKFNQGYYYSGFFLRGDIYLTLPSPLTRPGRDTMTKLDNSLRRIAADSKHDSPWQVHAVGLLRSLWWGVAWPDATAYSQDGIRLDYVTFDNNSGTRRGAPSPDINYIRQTYLPNIPGKLVYDEQHPNWIFSAFSQFAELYYNGWYIALSALALCSGIYVLWRGYPALAAPIYAFVANICVNVSLLNVFSRYIHILDALLVFQIALGVSLWLKKVDKTAAP